MGRQKESLKQAIMDEFLARMRRGGSGADREAELDPRWLYEEFLPSLSPKEEVALEEVLAEMLHSGLIVRTGGRRPSYRLTPEGADFLCL